MESEGSTFSLLTQGIGQQMHWSNVSLFFLFSVLGSRFRTVLISWQSLKKNSIMRKWLTSGQNLIWAHIQSTLLAWLKTSLHIGVYVYFFRRGLYNSRCMYRTGFLLPLDPDMICTQAQIWWAVAVRCNFPILTSPRATDDIKWNIQEGICCILHSYCPSESSSISKQSWIYYPKLLPAINIWIPFL